MDTDARLDARSAPAATVAGISVSWDSVPDLFTLDAGLAHLNHGSFGSVPVPVQRVQQQLRDEVEQSPHRFYIGQRRERLARARAHLADFLGTDPDSCGLVPNATAGVNVVLA